MNLDKLKNLINKLEGEIETKIDKDDLDYMLFLLKRDYHELHSKKYRKNADILLEIAAEIERTLQAGLVQG